MIHVAKPKALISISVSAYAKTRFSHGAAQIFNCAFDAGVIRLQNYYMEGSGSATIK